MKNKKRIIGILGVLLLGGLCAGFYIKKWEFRTPELEIHFFSLKRGRSIFIRTPEGKTILVDGGQNSEVIRELTRTFPFYRRAIDVVIATTALPKNMGGLADVLTRFEVGRVLVPIKMGTSTARDAFEKALKKKALSVEEVRRGDVISVGDTILRVMWPDPDFKFNKSSTAELVLSLQHGTSTLVFFGDVSKTIQGRVVKDLNESPLYLAEFAHGATKSRVSADLSENHKPRIMISSLREKTVVVRFKESI